MYQIKTAFLLHFLCYDKHINKHSYKETRSLIVKELASELI